MRTTVFHRTEHIPETNLLPLERTCPFCASREREATAIIQQDPDVFLMQCKHCHAASASRIPTSEALQQYYNKYYDGSDQGVTADRPSRIASHIFRCLQANPSFPAAPRSDYTILDFGGGDGSISVAIGRLLRANGIDNVKIMLIDYSQNNVATRDDNISVQRIQSIQDVPNQSTSLAIASAVIEHLPNPGEGLIKCLRSLRTDGFFYARTPFVLPLLRLFNHVGLKFDFTYPAHLHDLGARFWNNISSNLLLPGRFELVRSTPSVVETTLDKHFLRTTAAHVLKLPGYFFKEKYTWVGGWEVCFRRLQDQ